MKIVFGNVVRSVLGLLLVFVATATTAHNKVVVIPMSGDDLKPLKNIVSVAKENGDFSNPIAAINSITDASASNPYLMVIGPGIYDLGNNSLTLKPYVYVQGSGKDITSIRSTQVPEDGSTVKVVGNSALSDLSVVSSSNVFGDIAGVIGSGAGFLVRSCKIEASNPNFRAIGFALGSPGPSNGALEDVDIVVSGSFDHGLGAVSSFIADSSLHVSNSRFSVLTTGTAIARLRISSGAGLLVSDTLIELLGAGIGVGNTDGNRQVYHHITLRSSAANARGFSGAGSGFRPNIENSRIELTGSGSIAFSTNNGMPRLRNSFVQAAIGFTAPSAAFTPTYRVDHSIIDATNAVSLDQAGGNLNIRFGSTQLDSNTNINQINGTINATCINSYDEFYNALDGTCN